MNEVSANFEVNLRIQQVGVTRHVARNAGLNGHGTVKVPRRAEAAAYGESEEKGRL